MPADDYIKRSDALKAARYYKNRREENHVPSIGYVNLTEYPLLAQAINSIPAADVKQVKHGRWIQVPGKQARVCSRCEMDEPYKFADEDTNIYSWCPHCGAKMDRKADDE